MKQLLVVSFALGARQTGVGDLMEFICNEDNQYGAAGNFRPGTGAGIK